MVAEHKGGGHRKGHVDDLTPPVHIVEHLEHGDVVGQGGHQPGGRDDDDDFYFSAEDSDFSAAGYTLKGESDDDDLEVGESTNDSMDGEDFSDEDF